METGLDIAKRQLRRDEGVRRFAYKDTVGCLTIGVGRNLTDNGLQPEEIEMLLVNDLREADRVCQILFVNYLLIDPVRQAVLLELAFNVGGHRVISFLKMRECIKNQDWPGAARELLDSKWALQVGMRADRMAKQLETGVEQ